MRQVDIERFEKIEKLLPGVLGETEDILIEIEYDKETVYPAIKCQLMEIKRIVDNRIIPTDEEKERIRVGYLIEREFDGAGELPEYGKLVAEIGYIYDALGDPPEFKYFTLPKEKATYVDIPCECCGTAGYCLDGQYFGEGAKVKSVCVFCLKEGKKRVLVPDSIQMKLLTHLQELYPDKPDVELKKEALAKIDELERTPPVPWLTKNEWPVGNGDFTRYKYPMNQDMFYEGKEYFYSVVQGIEQIKDKEKLWDEIGKRITVFGFSVIGTEKYTEIVVPQSVHKKTVKAVWG
jgi:uncharacterized protein CbrC (UPF0167 family)